MNNSWDLLLKKLGIAKTFYDAMQKQYTVEDEALLKMVNYLGYPLKKIEDSAELLQKIEDKRWQSVLEPIYIVRSNNKTFDVVLKKRFKDVRFKYCHTRGQRNCCSTSDTVDGRKKNRALNLC